MNKKWQRIKLIVLALMLCLQSMPGAWAEQDVIHSDILSMQDIVAHNLVREIVADGGTYTITVTCGADSGVPMDAGLRVDEIVQGTEAYDEYYARAIEAVYGSADAIPEDEELSFARFFDITILSSDGEEIEPASEVEVSIVFTQDTESTEEIKAIHFDEHADDAVLDTDEAVVSEHEQSVSFATDGFSVYGFLGIGRINRRFTASDGVSYEITATYGADAGIPTGAQMSVREITEDELDYRALVSLSGEALNCERVGYAKLLDITILDADGQKVEITGPVNMSITILDGELGENAGVVHFGDEVEVIDSTVDEGTVSFAAESFSIYAVVTTITKNVLASDGRNYKITVSCWPEAGIPEDAELDVTELTGEAYADYLGRTAVAMDAAGFEYARIFDVSIVDAAGQKLQPELPVDVSIELMDGDGAAEDFTVVHFAGNEETPEQMNAQTDGNVVSFETDSFSAYAIVQGPSEVTSNWITITSLEELDSAGALYIGHKNGYFFTNVSGTVSGSRTGIKKTKPAQSTPPADEAAEYFFIRKEGTENQYYVYCLDDQGNRQYVYNNGNNSLSFTRNENNRTAFTVTASDGIFTLNNGSWYWNMQGSANGNYFCCYNNATDVNNQLKLWSYSALEQDPYGLDGKTYGLMSWNGGTAGKAMQSSAADANALDAKALTVMSTANHSSELFVPSDSEISMWTFDWQSDNNYYITSAVDGNTRYLRIGSDGISMVDTPDSDCLIKVIPGTGVHAGEICLKSNDNTLTYSGKVDTGFTVGGTTGSEYLKLVELSELTSDYFMTYSASKVSVSDPSVTNGSWIIVYTRDWNEETKRYDFYAVAHDGTLVPVYESGDSIEWVGGQFNHLLWDFVEYYWENTTDPNYYYELYNEYSQMYIAPQVSDGQVLSPDTIGIHLNGRRDGQYYTSILAWDDDNYAYAGLKVENGAIVSCPRSEAMDFYFAVMEEIDVDDDLVTVKTVDNTQYGVTMKLKNFGTRKEMSDFLGNDAGGAVTTLQQGLLSTNLGEDGYPTAAGGSLASLFSDAEDVNHLFIESTYMASGYYEYDSAQNFASLGDDGNFTVYKEIASYDSGGNKATLKHGQFFPYNDLQPGVFASVNGQNLYSATAQLLPDSDPRKYERLYNIENNGNKADCYFAMELEASFTQTENGQDDWGHDIIFEFSGDDDFWLYVDGELIIDLGGIHSAVPGRVNFKTGEVYVNGTYYTLRGLFESNYRKRNPGATDAEVAEYMAEHFDEGSPIFKDYTTHTMKIFYMERGAGASNLHMRFNLASVKPGTVLLNKKLSGVDTSEPVLALFPYQIKYKKQGDDTEYYLSNTVANDPARDIDYVFYEGTITPAKYERTYDVAGVTYDDVFLLKPDETVEISFPVFGTEGETIESYAIVECGVNTAVYESVKVNGEALNGTSGEGYEAHREDFATAYASTADRASVTYTNEVAPEALRTLSFKKKLYREDGTTELSYADDSTPFEFRLYLGTEFDSGEDIPAANMHTYHVKDKQGNYCTWDATNQVFVSTGITDYNELTDAQKTVANFTTSINGTISKVPAEYTIEVRNVLAGTKFRVVERPWNIPDGYAFQKYEYYEDYEFGAENNALTATEDDALTGVSDVVVADQDPHVDVCNLRGWGLRVNKVWSDADYMTDRDATYFAVYTDDGTGNLTLVPNTLRQMPYGGDTLYWYFLPLPVKDVPFDRYEIREVKVTGAIVNEEGYVTDYDTLEWIDQSGEVKLNGTQKGETVSSGFSYTVDYDKGEVEVDSNVRVDTTTNSRPGITLKKTDWDGQTPLMGARFTLTSVEGDEIGQFTSDAEGLITVAFLRSDVAYTLTETRTPQPYQGLQAPMVITQGSDGAVTVSGVDETNYILEEIDGAPVLTVKNRPYTLEAVKRSSYDGGPMEGVTFALHRQRTVSGVTSFDTQPMAGYGALVTGADGVIPKIDNTLPAGTYELREKATLEDYQLLPAHIHFTVSETGEVSLGSCPAGVTLETDESGNALAYTLDVLNAWKTDDLTIKKKVVNSTDTAKKFAFHVSVTWNDQPVSGTFGDVTLENGVNTTEIKLAHGESVALTGLPLGASYQVWEELAAGYISTPAGGVSGEINEGGNQAEITNTYQSQSVSVEFPVKKILEVPEGLTGPATWRFLMTASMSDGQQQSARYITNATADGTVNVGPFTLTKEGTYTCTVTETGTVSGVTNDAEAETGKTVTIEVVRKSNGALEATVTANEGGRTVTVDAEHPVTFTNTYSVEPTTASFPVKKVLSVPEGLTGPTEWSYDIAVTAQDGAPEAKTMTGTISNETTDQTIAFGEITYTAPGTYTYTVTENGEVAGVTNDDAAATGKTVTVTVVDNGDGTLSATADSTAESPLTFTNTYSVEPTTVSFPVKKVLSVPEGLTGPAAWSYDIAVAAQDGAPEAEKMTGTISNETTDQTITFGDITYTASGTYKYTVTERGEVAGVTNDEAGATGKTVTVTVVDNGNGTLTATADSTAESPLTFTNTYAAKPVTAQIPVTKLLTGADGLTLPDIAEQYAFALSAEEGTPLPEAEADRSAVNPEATGGTAEFGEITYTAPGTYSYTVTESGFVTGVKNDEEAASGKTATVIVTDDGKGALQAEVMGVSFTNTYEETQLTLTKEWVDADDQDGIRPAAEAFGEYLTLLADGTATGDYAPAVTAGDDANHYSITYDHLPKYGPNGEIVYTVAEGAIEGYETRYVPAGAEGEAAQEPLSDVGDGGTIVNTHVPETVDVTLTKTWDDDADPSVRPDADTFAGLTQLWAGETEITDSTELRYTEKTVTSVEGQYTITWQGLPKYAPGQTGTPVAYTVTEDPITDRAGNALYDMGTIAQVGENAYAWAVTNTRKVTTVTVKKMVTGNMGDRNRDFAFEALLTTAGDQPIVIDGLTDAQGKIAFSLKHDQTRELAGIPVGAKLVVTELDFSPYTLTIDSASGTKDEEEGTCTLDPVTAAANQQVTFNNEYKITIDTGITRIVTTWLPYTITLALALSGLALLIARRRRGHH